jgi:hypothetical protein
MAAVGRASGAIEEWWMDTLDDYGGPGVFSGYPDTIGQDVRIGRLLNPYAVSLRAGPTAPALPTDLPTIFTSEFFTMARSFNTGGPTPSTPPAGGQLVYNILNLGTGPYEVNWKRQTIYRWRVPS